jgi:halogenation protein CepH
VTTHDVVIVGGGPAGATAAAAAARAGLDVLVLEAGEHPRAHVGESLLPGIIPILDDIGALPAIQAAGFWTKTGSTLWDWGLTPRWDLWFADSDAYDSAWLVERARFDALLFEHARHCGADTRTKAVVRELLWDGERLEGVRWQPRTGSSEIAHARVVIDASGASALVARERSVRDPIEGLRHQCMWAHFENASRLPAPREHQALFVAQPQQWWWLFPLTDTRASVGVVQLDAGDRQGAPRRDFDALLQGCPELVAVLGATAQRCTPVKHERDWSYRMREVAGPGWLQVGDAAGFLDPVLSTGVMLALHTGWHAARCAVEIVGATRPEADVIADYGTRHRDLFEDLLRMVRFYYRQNLHREDYFWESKRILLEHDRPLAPQKAFILLTSGLIGNLALDDREAARRSRTDAPAIADAPQHLDFVGVHLRVHDRDASHASTQGGPPVRGSSLFLLLEPIDPGAPALATTANWHVNAIAPRHGNDPISVPLLAPVIRSFIDVVRTLDTTPGTSLASFWLPLRDALPAFIAQLPVQFELVRAFGE